MTARGTNLPRVKKQNEALIKEIIYKYGPISRGKIAEMLSLTPPTITTNVSSPRSGRCGAGGRSLGILYLRENYAAPGRAGRVDGSPVPVYELLERLFRTAALLKR